MRWPLRHQILLPLAGVTIVAVVAVSAANAFLAARRTEQQIVEQLENIADVVRPASFPLTDAVLKQARGLSGAELVVTNSSGGVQATSVVGLRTLSLARTPTTAGELGPIVEVERERFFHRLVEAPPRQSGGDMMRIHILYPERLWRESRRQAIYPPLLVGGLALVVAIAASMLLAQRVSRPLRQVQEQVGRIAEGDFRSLQVPPRDDELRDLALSINSMAEKLRLVTQTLRRAERFALLGQLGGGLAHHLRNDITGVKMAVQLHRRQCHDPDRESLEVALRQLTLTEEHLQQFLSVGQPREPRMVACDLRQIVAQMLRLVDPAARHRKIVLHYDALDEPLPLRADPAQLRQLLLNLVLNAIDGAGTGGWIRVTIEPRPDRRDVAIRVVDSGPGPPPEIRERLFEPFVTGKPEGIGLGLAAARQIAETHRGNVQLTSVEPCCFEVTLPASP